MQYDGKMIRDDGISLSYTVKSGSNSVVDNDGVNWEVPALATTIALPERSGNFCMPLISVEYPIALIHDIPISESPENPAVSA